MYFSSINAVVAVSYACQSVSDTTQTATLLCKCLLGARFSITLTESALHALQCCSWYCTQALAELAVSLPLPVVREHIQGPLLLSLYRRPDVVLALISIAGALGSTYTATQIIPPLLAILTSRVSGPAGAQTLSNCKF